MVTLGTAFDVIIVGALALPWVLLVIHLFFSTKEVTLQKLLRLVKDQNQPTLVSALLFAMAFPVGSAVARIAQDFFDDSDLHVHVNVAGYDRWFRLSMATETSIRTNVYCDLQEKGLKLTTAPYSGDKTAQATQSTPTASPCEGTEARFGSRTPHAWAARQNLEDLAERVFRIQEAAVLLQGTDSTERLRQFHDQIMVLRGATFNGMIALFLCVFWWSAGFRSPLRWTAPMALSLLGFDAMYNHLLERSATDPPYMEFTLLVLAAAGWYIIGRRTLAANSPSAEGGAHNKPDKIRVPYLVLATFLTATAFFGWWSTQVLYDQQVFYSYLALSQNPKPPAPILK